MTNKLSSNDIFEIKQSYRLAKDKDAQIDILSDLYLVDRKTIDQIVHEDDCPIGDSKLICPIKDIFGPKGSIRSSKMPEVVEWVKAVAPTHSVKDVASALGVPIRSVYRISSKNKISWKSKNELVDCKIDVDDTCEYLPNTSKSNIGPGAPSSYGQVVCAESEAVCAESESVDPSVPKQLCDNIICLCSKDNLTSADWFKLGTMLSRFERLL